jgi:hypothetical protein
LEADPGELEDIASTKQEVLERMEEQLLQHLAELARRGSWARREAPIPEELLEQLKNLRYVR